MAIQIRAVHRKDAATVEAAEGGAFTHGAQVTASNVGIPAGTTLTTWTDHWRITQDGQVIEDYDIPGGLVISANNVTIRRCRMLGQGPDSQTGGIVILKYGESADRGYTGLLMEDCEIGRPPGATGSCDYGIQFYAAGATVRRTKIHNLTSGCAFDTVGPITLEDCYIGELVDISGADHCDAVLSNGNAHNVTIRRCKLQVALSQTSPLAIYAQWGANTYWTVQDNWIDGGGFGIYASYIKGTEQPNNHFTVSGNVFGRTYFAECGSGAAVNSGMNGASYFDGVGNTWTGNTWGGGAAATASHAIGDTVTTP